MRNQSQLTVSIITCNIHGPVKDGFAGSYFNGSKIGGVYNVRINIQPPGNGTRTSCLVDPAGQVEHVEYPTATRGYE